MRLDENNCYQKLILQKRINLYNLIRNEFLMSNLITFTNYTLLEIRNLNLINIHEVTKVRNNRYY